jgi:hypothetical protein
MEKRENLSLTALSVPDVVRLLVKSGARNISEEKVRSDIESGAPVNADGTMNVVHYTAWLAKEVAHGCN